MGVLRLVMNMMLDLKVGMLYRVLNFELGVLLLNIGISVWLWLVSL